MDEEEGSAEAIEPTARMLSWARNSAAYRLSRRMMTERELTEAIKRKAKQKFEGVNEEQLTVLAAVAVDYGHLMHALDDRSYAEVKVRSSVRNGKSKRAIAQKLSEKGIDRDTVEQSLAGADDLRAGLAFARKRGFGACRVVLDDKRKAKELSAFARNGFGFDTARKVLEMERDSAEDVLATETGMGERTE